MKTVLISGNTHPGRRRKENEDTFTCRQLWSPDKALLVVVDGVGGYAGGDRAAAIARDSIDQYMQTPKGDTLTMLREAVIFANNRIAEERKKDPRYGDMCCVLTAAVADAATGIVYFAHVGDTRLYRYRKNMLEKLTRDHSFVGLREDAGQISEHEAMNHPQRNQILREVGSAIHRIDDEDFIEYGKQDLLPGDCLLLCSDGLTDMVTVQQISTILSTQVALHTKVNNLIALANEMGGRDNITVVLLKNNRVKQAATGTKVKKPVKAKNGTEAMAVLPLPAEKLVKDTTQQPAPVKNSGKANNWVKWNILVVLFLAVSSWFFFSQKDTAQPATGNKNNAVPQMAELPNDSLHKKTSVISSGQHTAPSGPAIIEQPDTIRLTTTKNILDIQHYADSVGKKLLLIPAKEKNNHLTALEINKASARKGDTMIIRNMHLKGFEIGIKVSVPVYIKLENMIFENVKYPVSYQYKADSNSNNNNHGVQMINTAIQ
jgi:serine/threonine protein phosphatase PrpC